MTKFTREGTNHTEKGNQKAEWKRKTSLNLSVQQITKD